jgi:hypothetical protein
MQALISGEHSPSRIIRSIMRGIMRGPRRRNATDATIVAVATATKPPSAPANSDRLTEQFEAGMAPLLAGRTSPGQTPL